MTPNNIINMALLKGLDIISITDHNSAQNLVAIQSCAQKAGLLFLPGMELETAEEIHVMCYFPDVDAAMKMQDIVYNSLPNVLNREDIYGKQLIMNDEDEIIAHESRFLLTATSLSIDEVYNKVHEMEGVVIPAHVDRQSYSILSNLGFMPPVPQFKYLELSINAEMGDFLSRHSELGDYRFIMSSDAHRLWEILEKQTSLELSEKSVRSVIEMLKMDNPLVQRK
jgi:PHP family Zn ribbon phosphoesterase